MQEKKKSWFLGELLILIILASLSFMVIPAWLPFLRRGWILLSAATIIIIFKWKDYINPQALLALLLYGFVVFLNSSSGDAYFGSWTAAIYEFLVLFVPSTLALFCTKGSDGRFVSTLIIITLIAFVFEMVASFIVLDANSGIVRSLYLRSMEEGGSEFMYSFYKLGILDYYMGHAIPILIAPLFCVFKETQGRERIACFTLIVVCVILTWMSESATAMLLMALMLLLGFLISKNRSFGTNVFIISIAMILAAGMMSNVMMSGLFDFLISLFGDDSVVGVRLGELQMSLYEDQLSGDLEARMNLYGQSLGYLSDGNLLFGSNSMPGRHSGILDRFAVLGLVGFIPLLLFLYFSLKAIWYSLPKNHRIYYLQCILAALLMLSFKGAWVWPIFFALYIVAPCLLVYKRSV